MSNDDNQDRSTASRALHGVLAEYIRRREAGESVDIESFCAAYPELADGLRSYAEGEGLLDALSDPAGVDVGNSPAAETLRPGAAQRTDFAPQAEFGRYRLIRQLGNGAMGAVYLAEDTQLGRQVALKIPRGTGTEGPEFLKRFTRESQAAARLDHPNLCRIYDAGDVKGTPFISMEYIDGPPLSQCVGVATYQDQRRIAEIVCGIASGLQLAHERGILHRDVKSSNVLMRNGETPCVTDFGLARIEGRQESKLTRDGAILGTPAYMAPEQIRAELDRIGPPSDVYALGVILYELVAGHTPFQGSTLVILNQALNERPPSLRKLRPEVDPQLADFCLRMLDKKPEQRPQSMQEVVDFLQQWLKTTSPESQARKAKDEQERTKYEAMKSRALELIQRGQHAQAIDALEKMQALNGTLAKPYAEWARAKIPEVKKLAKKLKEGIPALLAMARKLLRGHDYAQAVQLLQDIPPDFRSLEIQQTLDEALELQEESDLLLLSLQECVRTRQMKGIEDNLKRYLKLKPGSKFAQELWESLQTYGKVPLRQRKYKFDEKGRLQPLTSGSIWDNWLLMGTLCFAFVFGLMTWAIVVYLKDGKRTLAVEVNDAWLKEQGGQLSLSVDGKEHTITGPGFDIKVSLGDRGFSVKNGDTVVHNPQTFTIEKGTTEVLRIDASGMSLTVAGSVPVPSSPPVDETGWISLFNGKDLTGWDGDPEIWKTANGILSVKRPADAARFPAYLVWQGGQPADFDLKFDVKLVHGGANIVFRGRKLDNPHVPVGGYECYLFHMAVFPGLLNSLSQVGEYPKLWLAGRGDRSILLKDQAPQVQRIADPGQLFREHVKPGNWNSFEISTRGEVISVKVNDQDMATIIDRIDNRAERRGLIAISAFYSADVDLEFRNLRLREVGQTVQANAATLPDGPPGLVRRLTGHVGPVNSVVFIPDGKQALSTSGWPGALGGEILLWDLVSGKRVKTLAKREGGTGDLCLSRDGAILIHGDSGPSIRWIDCASGNEIGRINHTDSNCDFELLPDQRRLLVGEAGPRALQLWSLDSKSVIRKYDTPDVQVFSIAVSPDGSQVACGTHDGHVRVYETETGQLSADFPGHNHWVEALCFSPDGKLLLSGANDSTARLVNLARKEHLHTFQHDSAVRCVTFTADGRHTVTTSSDKTIRMWNVATGKEVHRLEDHQEWVFSVHVSPDGKYALSGGGGEKRDGQAVPGSDWNLRLWRLPKEVWPKLKSDTVIAAALPTEPKPQSTWRSSSGADFVWCPPGMFRMGSGATPLPDPNETPTDVTLTKGLWIAKQEVTQGQWKAVMETEPWKSFQDHRDGANHAASHVTWTESVEFCRKLTEAERKAGTIPADWEFRLPTEAEWEYFARAGTTTRYSFGNDGKQLSDHAWWRDNAVAKGENYAHEVGKFKPNPWGLYDIHGNVYEWCRDTFVAKLPGGTDPLVREAGKTDRVNRGGGWDGRDELAHTSSNRRWTPEGERRNNLGLRVVLSATPRSSAMTVLTSPSTPPSDKDVFFTNTIGMRFRMIATGEIPAPTNRTRGQMTNFRTAKVDKEFLLGTTEVTYGQWKRVMGVKSWPGQRTDDHPVTMLTWAEANEFCRRLSAFDGNKYRLPTIDEARYAAQADNPGDAWSDALFDGRNSEEVTKRTPNAWGLYGMYGNVSEWTTSVGASPTGQGKVY